MRYSALALLGLILLSLAVGCDSKPASGTQAPPAEQAKEANNEMENFMKNQGKSGS